MCIALAIGAGLAVAGTVASSQASRSQENAANRAAQTQRDMYAQTNTNQAPFRQAGLDATQALGGFYGLPGYAKVDPSQQIQNLPGYQFQLNQGVQAIDRSAASRGLLNSGATGKALAQYGQGLAQSYAGQYTQGLQDIANRGEGATQSTAAAGAGAANQISADQNYAGQAAAQGDIGTFNAISSGLGQGVGIYGYNHPSLGGNLGGGGGYQQPNFTPGLPGGYNMNSPSSPWNYNSVVGLT